MLPRILLVLLVVLPVAAQKKTVTIDALVSIRSTAEDPGPAIWAPDGRTFAYRQGERVMLYEIARKQARELLSLAPLTNAGVKVPPRDRFDWENRGVHEAAIQWMPSGQDLLISTGSDLFLWHLQSGTFDQLTATAEAERDPKPSPDGRFVAFRRNHDLYALELASNKETRLTSNGSETLGNGETDWVYPEELALGTAYWWSPDSRSIAFLQFDVSREPLYPQVDLGKFRAMLEPQRYPQAGEPNADVALGVVPVTGGPARWMDVGSTRYQYLIARVEWMPDARHLAVQRLTRVQDRLDLLSADCATGETRPVLRETDPYWINVSSDLRFLEDGKRFLWSSERDGYRHLYLYTLDGRQLRQLTDGPWEVRGVAGIDPKTDRVYYLSSEASPMETQLYSIRLNGRDKARITTEPGVHSISFSPGTAYFTDSYSNTTTPSRRVLRTAQGTEYAVLRESNRSVLDEYNLMPSEVVTIKAADGKTELYGALTKPFGFQSGRKYPAIVVVYGGPGAQSVTNAFRSLTIQQMMAHRGYVVWELDNRGSAGRGHLFEAAVNRSLGAAELADQKAGVDYLTSLGFVDAERIGVYGWSYGGFMTLNCMLNSPGTFRAGIAGAPVTNFVNYDTIYTERYMGLPASNPEGYKKTDLSPRAGEMKGKLMIVHNFQDDNVLFQNTLQIVDALERANQRFELMIYPQKTHGVSGPVRRQMLESMMDFFDRTLKF